MQSDNKENIELIQKAKSFAQEKNFPSAIECCNEAINLDFKNYDAYFYRSIYHLRLQNYRQSIADNCVVIFGYGDGQPTAFYNRGLAYLNLKEYDKGITDFSISMLDKDLKKGSLYFLSKCYYRIGKTEEALSGLNSVISIYPDYENAISLKNTIFLKDYKYEKALPGAKELINISSKSTFKYFNKYLNLIELYILNKNYRKALKTIEFMEALLSDYNFLRQMNSDEIISGYNTTQYAYRIKILGNYFKCISLRLLNESTKNTEKALKAFPLKIDCKWNFNDITDWIKQNEFSFFDRRYLINITKNLVKISPSNSKQKSQTNLNHSNQNKQKCKSCNNNTSISQNDIINKETTWVDVTKTNEPKRMLICGNCGEIYNYSSFSNALINIKMNKLEFYRDVDIDALDQKIYTYANVMRFVNYQRRYLESQSPINDEKIKNKLDDLELLFAVEELPYFNGYDNLPRKLISICQLIKQQVVKSQFLDELHRVMVEDEESYPCPYCDEESSNSGWCTNCGNDI